MPSVPSFQNALDVCERGRGVTRDEMAAWYAAAMRYDDGTADWRILNAAIIRRWSESGLAYIKTRAWKALASDV